MRTQMWNMRVIHKGSCCSWLLYQNAHWELFIAIIANRIRRPVHCRGKVIKALLPTIKIMQGHTAHNSQQGILRARGNPLGGWQSSAQELSHHRLVMIEFRHQETRNCHHIVLCRLLRGKHPCWPPVDVVEPPI